MITVVGLGPGDLDRVPRPTLSLLLDEDIGVIARTAEHPAAAELAKRRQVTFCDDLYESEASFEDVYAAIVDRVLEAAKNVPIVYAVPGSPLIGEFAVRGLLESDADVEIVPGESFVDAILARVGYDPLDRGIQILNGHDLPDPIVLDKPTIIGQVDKPEILADVCAELGRVLPEETMITVVSAVGAGDEALVESTVDEVDSSLAGFRTSLYVDPEPGGLVGAVRTMRILREECPWDRDQTHQSLIKNLVEESYELIDAIERLGSDTDWAGYAEVEDELGDVLLQVLFHAAIARQVGAFDIDDAAEVLRQKLVRRHPHVFGDVEASSAAEVKANWDRIKEEERGVRSETSAMDGVPAGMPALHRASKIQNRAAKVGFDWDEAAQVFPKVVEELDELSAAVDGDGDIEAELGDVLFSVVNLSRHLGLDAEVALRGAIVRFEDRFKRMEQAGPLQGLDLDTLNERWAEAKGGR